MATQKNDQLFDLIRTLKKAEKRNFRIYAKKIQQKDEVLFLQLFDYLDKQEVYDLEALLESSDTFQKKQIPNLKRNLYQHLLNSLRLLYSHKQVTLQIREFLDYAEILYSKGLYLQALKILGRAKKISTKSHQDVLHLEIIAFETRIESRHITRSSTQRMSDLIQESLDTNETINLVSKLSSLKLYLQRVFINEGHLKVAEDVAETKRWFSQEMDKIKRTETTFFENVFYYQSYYWYHFLLQEFEQCHKYAQKWVALYDATPNMVEKDIDMYLRAMHHLLNTQFFVEDSVDLVKTVSEFERFIKQHKAHFSENAFIQAHLFLYQAKFNTYFLQQDYKTGLSLIKNVEAFIKTYNHQLDNYKIMILYYKIASCYFGAGQAAKTIDYLNHIIHQSKDSLREDILLYARLLLTLAHFELQQFDILDFLINTLQRQINQIDQPDQLSVALLQLFKKLYGAIPGTEKRIYGAFLDDLRRLKKETSERRAFIFLNIEPWILAKVGNKKN